MRAVICLAACLVATSTYAQVRQVDINAAVRRAAAYVEKELRPGGGGTGGLGAYALLKAKVPPTNAKVAATLADIVSKVKGGTYTPYSHHYYEAGCDLMALEAADPKATKYKAAMEAMVAYIESGQQSGGSWYYPNKLKDAVAASGDTSITQYALLGLWAASRAGITVRKSTFDRAASWHIRTQLADGGWGYHPGERSGLKSKHTLTCAGIGSLVICMRELYPGSDMQSNDGKGSAKKKKKKKGPLEEIDLDNPPPTPGEKPDPRQENSNYKPQTQISAIKASARRGLGWLTARFIIKSNDWPMYYVYGLERALALANVQSIKGINWYQAGAAHLLRTQKKEGNWTGSRGGVVPTAFGILFLERATGRVIKREVPKDSLAGGQLKGNRGLPGDLSELATTAGGDIKKVQKLGPLDELLTQLGDPDKTDLDVVTEAIVEKVQIGDREKLIGQKDLLLRYVNHKSVDVRRVAYWALGRCEDLKIAGVLVKGLSDPDLDAAVEARNALCVLSRRTRGLLSERDQLPDLTRMTDAQKLAAAKKWRASVQRAWKAWYFKNRPYDQRNDLDQFRFEAGR